MVPPKEYLRELRKFCDEHSITMIVDEVQTGFGRTGKMFAIEHSKIVPDIMTLAKSIAAGLPLAAVVGKREIMNSVHPGGLGGTFGGNPIACTAAIEVIEIIKNNLPNAIKIGKILKRRCMEFFEKYEFIGDVRGLGPMVGIEIVRDRKTKEPNKKLCEDIIHKCLKKGLLIMKAGIYNNVIRFLPPLVAKTEIVEQAMDIFEDSLSDV
ncbi:MAG: aminotransferase class III-fold pyridoxal phosphate-dependent enzyme [Archaeoglobaceae archaeon]|nr:aminotransferase class III-fold pyridoxal phosphate-dependent enzyme [Archaeoglobaceae archaeon]